MANEVIDADEKNDPPQKRIKIDGAWQRRGHALLNGFVSGIVDDKCVDYEALTKFCMVCRMWEHKRNSPRYEAWKASHICDINHTQSSGAMEAAGAVQMFNHSIEKNNIIYSHYLGDGNTSSFKDVVKSDPYKDHGVVAEKLECVGHAQKRVYERLRNLVKSHKGTATPLSGRNKLTESVCMQNWCGLAIRNNTDNSYAMKKAVWAILFHRTEYQSPDFRHRYCPRDESTWCKYRYDELHGTSKYDARINLPMWISDLLKPTFIALSDEALLAKCVHGQTQNTNESLNSVVWTRCPKNIFVGRQTFEMAINSAVLQYNDGTVCV